MIPSEMSRREELLRHAAATGDVDGMSMHLASYCSFCDCALDSLQPEDPTHREVLERLLDTLAWSREAAEQLRAEYRIEVGNAVNVGAYLISRDAPDHSLAASLSTP